MMVNERVSVSLPLNQANQDVESQSVHVTHNGQSYKLSKVDSDKYNELLDYCDSPLSKTSQTSVHPPRVLSHISKEFHCLIYNAKVSPTKVLGELVPNFKYVVSTIDDINIPSSSKLRFTPTLRRAFTDAEISHLEPKIPETLVKEVSRTQLPETEKESGKLTLEAMETKDLQDKMSESYQSLPDSIYAKLSEIHTLISETKQCIYSGGRVFLLGAGTSGRIAAECSSYNPESIIVIPSGGQDAIFVAKEGAEDEYTSAWIALKRHGVSSNDIVIGLSASGTAPFVVGGLCCAQAQGIKTAAISCNDNAAISKFATHVVEVPVGSEFITGSTRLKSGSLQLFITSLLASTSVSSEFDTIASIENLLIELKRHTFNFQFCGTEMQNIIEVAATAIKNKGRIIYVGNDACGRLGIIDASECPPTFGTKRHQVQGIIIEGDEVFKATCNAELGETLEAQLERLELNKNDAVIMLLSCFHRELNYVHIISHCKKVQANCAAIEITRAPANVNQSIVPTVTLPVPSSEGSTAEILLKMQLKQALNLISTIVMIQDGRVVGNRMSKMSRTNQKLQRRELHNLASAIKRENYFQCGALLSLAKNTDEAKKLYEKAIRNKKAKLTS